MIDAVPQQPLPPRLRESSAKPERRETADDFAQIFATAAGKPSQPRSDKGPVGDEPSGLDPTIQPGTRPGNDDALAAEQFNQNGFFRSAVPNSPAGVAGTMPTELPPSHLVSETALPTPSDPLAIAPRSAQPKASGPTPAIARLAQRLSAKTIVVPPRTGVRASAGATVPAEISDAAEPVRPSAQRRFLREPAARAAIQVALRELEQGLHVSARTEALDESERLRLRDEIAALLARHGLAPRTIRISAPARPPFSQEEPK